jgi:hypothetical protein
MLIHIFRLTIQSMMDVIIDNQCTDIELTSPVHFIKNATFHMQFPQHVNSNSIVKANFAITGINRNTFGGALLYRLQRKEDESKSIQFLVIWGCESDSIYLRTWLIKRENTLVWSENKLKELYHVYDSQHKEYSTFTHGR